MLYTTWNNWVNFSSEGFDCLVQSRLSSQLILPMPIFLKGKPAKVRLERQVWSAWGKLIYFLQWVHKSERKWERRKKKRKRSCHLGWNEFNPNEFGMDSCPFSHGFAFPHVKYQSSSSPFQRGWSVLEQITVRPTNPVRSGFRGLIRRTPILSTKRTWDVKERLLPEFLDLHVVGGNLLISLQEPILLPGVLSYSHCDPSPDSSFSP